MDTQKVIEGTKMIARGMVMVADGEFEWNLQCMAAATALLLEKYAPFIKGNRVRLTLTPEIVKDSGWYFCRHFLVQGAQGTVSSVEINPSGVLTYNVIFDHETWIDKDGKEQPPINKHTFGFKEHWLVKIQETNDRTRESKESLAQSEQF